MYIVLPMEVQISPSVRIVWSRYSLDAFWTANDAKFDYATNIQTFQTVQKHMPVLVSVRHICTALGFHTFLLKYQIFKNQQPSAASRKHAYIILTPSPP